MSYMFLLIAVVVAALIFIMSKGFKHPDFNTVSTPWYNNVPKLGLIAISGLIILFILTL